MSVKLYSKETWGICKCGHYQWQHDDSIPEGEDVKLWYRSDGHGRCNFGASDIPCGCKQFTWIKNEKAHWAK